MGQTEHVCTRCQQEIKGSAMKAKERLYCEETCFICTTCKANLKDLPVYSKEDVLYCEDHYKANFMPKCASCQDYITEVCKHKKVQKKKK